MILVIISGVIALGSSGGRNGAHAGAPGDGQCGNCHTGGSLDGSITLTGLPTSMQPNTTYQMTVTINDADAAVGGFQIIATDGGANNTLIGSFNTTTGETRRNNLNRLVQSTPKAFSGGSVTWNIEWVSPSSVPASNEVKFYVSGNAADGTGGTGNDAGYSTSSATIALPVELIAFNGQTTENGVKLEWATATETNNKGFDVQRSQDGQDWETLDFVEGNGTTIESQVYEFIDENPLSVNYYRLKQQDFDGQFAYSEMIRIENNTTVSNISLYPNPTIDRINFSENIQSTIRLFDINGRLIRQYSNPINNSIDVSMIQKGMYFLEFENQNGKQQIEKIVIVR